MEKRHERCVCIESVVFQLYLSESLVLSYHIVYVAVVCAATQFSTNVFELSSISHNWVWKKRRFSDKNVRRVRYMTTQLNLLFLFIILRWMSFKLIRIWFWSLSWMSPKILNSFAQKKGIFISLTNIFLCEKIRLVRFWYDGRKIDVCMCVRRRDIAIDETRLRFLNNQKKKTKKKKRKMKSDFLFYFFRIFAMKNLMKIYNKIFTSMMMENCRNNNEFKRSRTIWWERERRKKIKMSHFFQRFFCQFVWAGKIHSSSPMAWKFA